MPATIRRGSSGPDVVQWQGIIGVTADGKFGPATEAATKSYQKSNGLTADGIVGPATWGKALSTFAPGPPKASFAPPTPPPTTFAPSPGTTQQTIRRGSIGPTVVQWQKIIGVTADGNFGPATETATKAWQRDRGLTPDGIVGPKTWGYVPSSAPPAPAKATFRSTTTTPARSKVVIPPVKSSTPTTTFAPQAEKPPTFAPSPGTKTVPSKRTGSRPVTEKTEASAVSTPFNISKWPGWAQVLAAVSAVAGIFFVGKRMKKIG